MLRLSGGQVGSLFDLGLPVEVRELPTDLAALDVLLGDPALLVPVEAAWDAAACGFGRPTIPIERLIRSMVIKQRSGWGYETLVGEVSDSLHLRRFCRIALSERVPDESTIRKLVRRLGPEVIEEITRAVIANATTGERRFVARAARIDSTVVEADIRYPTDLGLAGDATKVLAREATAARELVGGDGPRVRDRSRAVAQRLRRLNRTLAARTGQGKPTALRLTGEAGRLVERSIRETRRLAEQLRQGARGRGADAKLAAAQRLDELTDRAAKVTRQIRQRLAGEKLADRVRLRHPTRRGVREHSPRRPRPDRPRRERDRLPERARPAPDDSGRAKSRQAAPARACARRRVLPDRRRRGPARTRSRVHRRPPVRWLPETPNGRALHPRRGRSHSAPFIRGK